MKEQDRVRSAVYTDYSRLIPSHPFYVSYKKKLGVPSVKPLTVVMRIFAGVFGFVLLSYRYLTDRAMCIIF